MSKNTKIILGVVGVVVVLLAIRWSVQSRMPAGVKTGLMGDKTYTMKSADGGTTVTSGGSVPSDFPSDVPVYGNSTVISSASAVNAGGMGHVLNLETSSSVDSVIDFYKKELAAKGWTVMSNYASGETKMLVVKKGEVVAMVSAINVDGKTQVVLSVGAK